MILAYIKDGIEIKKTIKKFWYGTQFMRYELKTGQLIEVPKIEQFFIYNNIHEEQNLERLRRMKKYQKLNQSLCELITKSDKNRYSNEDQNE